MVSPDPTEPLQCAACGFVYDEAQAPQAAVVIARSAGGLAQALRDDPHARRRPQPEVWSPLEYGCHVRDVLLVQRERVLQALREECPIPPAMGRDERAEADGYSDQDPDDVARQVVEAARMFGNVLHRLDPEQWERRMVYGYPVVAERNLRWIAVHTEHEVVHHLGDVTGTDR